MGDEHVAPVAEIDPFLGRTVEGKYLVEELLGSGAMGSVYRARQVALDRHVALKVMSPALANDPSFVDRFHREARMASRLWHPNSVSVTDFGEAADGLLYIVMELVPGRNLDEIIQAEFPLGDARIVAILSQVLSAVAAAHDLGIVHRDLKPENLLVIRDVDDDGAPRDTVKVCDFGLARGLGVDVEELRGSVEMLPAGPTETTVGVVLGTPAYMSPEQASGLAPEKRSDLYAVGAMLYEMLTKEIPFERATLQETVLAHVNDVPRDPRLLAPDCSPALAAICLRALAKRPEDRPPNARAMRAAIQRALGNPDDESIATLDELRAPESIVPLPRRPSRPATDATTTLAAVAPAPSRSRSPLLLGLGALVVAGLVYAAARPRAHAPVELAVPPAVVTADEPARLPAQPTSAAATVEPSPPKGSPLPPVVVAARPTATSPRPSASVSVVQPEPAPPAPEPVVPIATVAAPAVPAVVAPPVVAAPPPYQPDRAAVTVTVAEVSGTSRKTIAALVGHVNVTDCYQSALRMLGRAEGGQGTVHLDIDEDGVITAATVKLPPALGEASGCIRARLLRQRLGRPPDTGSASSELSIQLTP